MFIKHSWFGGLSSSEHSLPPSHMSRYCVINNPHFLTAWILDVILALLMRWLLGWDDFCESCEGKAGGKEHLFCQHKSGQKWAWGHELGWSLLFWSFLIKAEAAAPLAASCTLCFWDLFLEAQPRLCYLHFLMILQAVNSPSWIPFSLNYLSGFRCLQLKTLTNKFPVCQNVLQLGRTNLWPS